MKKEKLEHFEYEMDMFFSTFIMICNIPNFYFAMLYCGEEIRNIMTNALIESYCMHYRLLLDSLFCHDERNFNIMKVIESGTLGDLSSKIFPYKERAYRIKDEISQRVAHLSLKRIDYSKKEFLGNFVESIKVIIELYDIAMNYVENDKLIEKYKKYKAQVQRIEASNLSDRITTTAIGDWF